MNSPAINGSGATPQPGPGITGPVLLVVAGGAVSQAAITRTAALAAGAPVTVVGVGSNEISRTGSCSAGTGTTEPEQVRRTVALAMSVLENAGVMATGHVAVTGPPARAVARVARACGARVVILDQSAVISRGDDPPYPPRSAIGQPAHPGMGGAWAGRSGAGTARLMAELRRRMYGSGVVVLAESDRRGGWVSVLRSPPIVLHAPNTR
jgi:hypothetical protein